MTTETGGDVAARGPEDVRLAAIVAAAVDGIITIDERGRIEELNPAALRMFGYEAGELLGRNVSRLMPEPYRSEHDGYLRHYLETGERRVIGIGREVTCLRKDGTTFPAELAVSEILLHDRRIFAGVVRDITERKHAEAELRAAKEAAEAASLAKDRFLAVLSHELRTPLTPVLATISCVETMTDLPPRLREEIVSIRRNVETEARLIDDLLDVTRISRGKVRLQQESVDAHAVLRAALEVCQYEAEAKGLDVVLSLRARDHHVWADPARLQQVFWNLIKNAVKFTPADGEVRLRTSNDADGRVLTVEVADTGIGIDPVFLPHVFNAFEQAEASVTRRYGGLGLGLTIARSLVDLHGGSLAAHSEGVGRGATFRLQLPTLATPADTPMPVGPERPVGAQAFRILFVEDNPDTLRALTRLLRFAGFSVEPASTVSAAFAAAARETFDLLISDIGLPDGSGLDVIRHVRERYGVRGIAFSGYGTDDDVRASKEAGFEHHLTKPVDFRALTTLIRSMAG